ncbi:neuropilin and tolloid-like isoform 2-T5 [Cochliomyia hominivorax]
MKLSSSTLCGCCFCCYCHCWLMMLLMVSSVVHVSPEMSTTLTSTTTTTKKYTKLYNNNNYAYQSEMTEEFIQLNRKISNRTKSREVVATATTTSSSPTFPSTAMLPLLPQIHEPVATTTTTGDYHYKPNNEQSFIKFEHETITTIATIQTQQLTISTSHLHATATTTPAIPLATTTTMISTLTLAPEQIQMNKKQQNPYKKVETKHSENVEREEEEESNVYTFDNSIEEEEEAEVTTSRTITTTTNYAADNSHVFVPPTILSIESTTEHFVKPMKKILSNNKNNNSSNNNNNNVKSTKYWNISIDLQPNKTRNQQQENNTSNSKSKSSDNNNSNTSSSSNSDNSLNNHNEGSKDFVNSNYRSSNSKQKTTTNTFSLNHNNRYGTVNKNNNNNNSSTNTSTSTSINFVTQNHVATKIENGTATTTTTRVLNATAINSLPSSGTFDFHNKTSKTHNFKNHNNKNSKSNNNSSNNYYDSIATSTDSDSNLSPKEMNQYTDITKTHHHNQHRPQLQMPTTSLSAATATTTALRIPTTYTPLHEYHGHSQMKRPVLLHRHARQAAGAAATDDEQNDKCRMFVEGDPEKNELYSPDYPNDYPKNINCTRVIIAPKGQIIRLDFRNSFHIEEKEECKFDFLEIRDGQYGFSNLIGKFCGTDFPPEITSKERYLWLHFHSDESIEYSGFTAVYEFIDRNRDAPSTDLNCTIERDGFEGFVNASDVPTEIKETVIRNKIPLDCMWRIQVQEKWKIQVKFVDFKLAKPNDCESNFLDIFPEQTVMPLRVKNFCGSAGEGITSESNILHVRFYAEQSAITSSFSILYTAFRERGSSSCAEDEYDCEDATCIAGNLKCNGRSNCKFLWDEEGCKPEDNGQSEHMIIIITVFGLILGGMVITFLVNCVRKIMHDQKIIREVPVLSDGIYHIDSFILDAPKTAICVGLQDDYKLHYKPHSYLHDYTVNGHDNMKSIDMEEDISSNTSYEEDNSYTTQSENKNSIDSIELHENCCTAYNNYKLNNDNDNEHNCDETSADDDNEDDDENIKHVFDNDEFIIVPHVPPKLITSHCNLHSGLMILAAQPDNEFITTPITSDSCNSSPAPSSGTINTTTNSSSADSNYISAKNAATATNMVNGSTLSTSCYRDDSLHIQCFMQKCAH